MSRYFRGLHGRARLHHEPSFTVSAWFVSQGYLTLKICLHELTCWLGFKGYITRVWSISQIEAVSTSCRRGVLEDKRKIKLVNIIFTCRFLKVICCCAVVLYDHVHEWRFKWFGSMSSWLASIAFYNLVRSLEMDRIKWVVTCHNYCIKSNHFIYLFLI